MGLNKRRKIIDCHQRTQLIAIVLCIISIDQFIKPQEIKKSFAKKQNMQFAGIHNAIKRSQGRVSALAGHSGPTKHFFFFLLLRIIMMYCAPSSSLWDTSKNTFCSEPLFRILPTPWLFFCLLPLFKVNFPLLTTNFVF